MSQRRATDQPDWPAHHTDAPPPEDPRSLKRGIMAGLGTLLMAGALAIIGPFPEQTRLLTTLLGWMAAVGVGAWAYRGASPRVVPVTRIVLALGLVALLGAAMLVFISLQVREILAGTVIFGSSGEACDVEAEAETFTLGEPVYAVAHMQRVIETGEEVTMTVTWDGEAQTTAAEVSPQDFDCLGSALQPPGAGSYAVVLEAGDEVLAAGSFEVLPEAE